MPFGKVRWIVAGLLPIFGGECVSLAPSPYSVQKTGGGDFWQITLLTRELGYGIIRDIQKKGIRLAYGMVVIP